MKTCTRTGHQVILIVTLGATLAMHAFGHADEPPSSRQAAWKAIETALSEGKPKTAADLLTGIEQAAIAEKAWAEAARAIATRVFTDCGDRPGDDPERLVQLAAAIAQAPPETRGVLQAIQANWTWQFFTMNRWRFMQRTAGAAQPEERAALASIATWDLPAIIAEIRARFAAALGADAALRKLPIADWSMLIERGTMSDAYRPTVWDVVVHDALAFAASGERGLAEPEDAFEIEASGAAFGTPDEFRGTDLARLTPDIASPKAQAWGLYAALLDFHAGDADRTAFLAADLDRILWAATTAVDSGDTTVADRTIAALEAFIERAGRHEITSLARYALAERLHGQGDFVAARAIATEGMQAHPASVGGRQCRNLIAVIDSRELTLATERAWAAPWPVVRVTYRNLAKVHLRLAKADWRARLKAGKPHASWLDDADRAAILALPAVKTFATDLPRTDDYCTRHHDIPVATAFGAEELEPGAYWVIASHTADFGDTDNTVHASLVWVTRLAIVSDAGDGSLSGHVVDLASGEPVAGAQVTKWVREERGNPPAFIDRGGIQTDSTGRFEVAPEQGRETVLMASATIGGRPHSMPTASTHVWGHGSDQPGTSIVLVTDRGIHRPGQIVFYKGVACSFDHAGRNYHTLNKRPVTVALRDANGREVARTEHTTSDVGSFHGNFTIPTGGLPGRWMLTAETAGHSGGIGVQVEEYKRPKFRVELAAPTAAVKLDADVTLTGTATTYTGLAVAGAKVKWRVEREVRFPIWCRWFFPWLLFGGESRKIARGIATSDEGGAFTIRFPAVPDRSVPRDSLPVFSYRVVADVTDSGGETHSAERSMNAGYTDTEATVSADDWQAVGADGQAAVTLTLATTSLDGGPRAAAGTLTIHSLVQPAEVLRGEILDAGEMPRPVRGTRGRGRPQVVPPPRPQLDTADPNTWADGDRVQEQQVATDKATGKATATLRLPIGIYRATFTLPAIGDAPAVKSQIIVEVIDPTANRMAVKQAFVMKPQQTTVEVSREFSAVVGTGYTTGRALVEISQAGKTLSRSWTEPGRTQWPVSLAVGEPHRGGFTVTAWMVRNGRLHRKQRVIDVPWTNKHLAITWERFTRRLEPAAQEVWRAQITSVADPLAGPATPAVAEMLALLYDQSLDALVPHEWPGHGLLGMFRREWGGPQVAFTNAAELFVQIRGAWRLADAPVEITYREFREPFGPAAGRRFAIMGAGAATMMMRKGGMRAMPMEPAAPAAMMAEAAPADASRNDAELGRGAEAPPRPEVAATAPPPRTNLVETAFFLPTLTSDKQGVVTIEFTLPDTLTTWQFKGLAHDAALRSGTITDTCVSAKDLMVEPLLPRFLREGDVVQIPVKVSNTTTGRLAGTVRLSLADARTSEPRDTLIDGPREQSFDLTAGESKPAIFTVNVADGADVLRVLAVGTAQASARPASDGEESLLPVLPRRVPVTETVPLTIRGPGSRAVTLDRLAKSAGTEIRSQSLVVQAASNPAWYGVLALPAIMEQADESTETLFTRLYANTLARHIVTRDPRIEKIFAQWKGTAALDSPLEKNTDLVKTLLAETPWVRDAVDEKEARARIALLFDATRAENESRAALDRLQSLRNGDGGWPWFPGGSTCDPVSLGIIAGFGRLRAAGVRIDIQPAIQAIPWLDSRLIEERKWAEKRSGNKPDDIVLTTIGAYALYARSFFTKDAPPQGEAAAAIGWGLDVAKRSWAKLDGRMAQGHVTLALARSGDKATALSIIDGLKQRSVDADVKPGAEKENWQGMWWRDPHPGWWSWSYAPIATQSIMIEAFDEVAGDANAVEAMKAWLLSQKRTSQWRGSRATADAVAALFGRGVDLLASTELVDVTIGGEPVQPAQAEAGTGFFEERRVRNEITPAAATVTITKKDAGLAWGGVHWHYLDDIANVPAAGREELAIDKKLFVKRFTKAGAELVPAEQGVEVGDELIVRLVVTSDRDYEFLELADHRPSLTEPVDVVSGWRWSDGAGWYLAIRDASTQFFFQRLPRGTHVFEYSLRAAHRGQASSGFARIQSRYAPEFSAHSASIPVSVK